MTPILLFPGQSSFHSGILDAPLHFAPGVTGPLVDAASKRLGCDLRGEIGDTSGPRTSWRVQVGVFLANHLHLMILRAAGLPPGPSAGMSLGEYNHLVDIESIDFLDALEIVDHRGRLYDSGPDGIMAALFPIEAEVLMAALLEFGDSVSISNYNSPTQHVVAGERAAVESLLRRLDEEHFLDARIIEDRLPMHSPRVEPLAQELRPHLQRARWQRPRRPYLPNVTGEPIASPSTEDICELLFRHVFQPVRWRTTMDWLARSCPASIFVETGPGQILTGLLRKEWRPEPRLHTATPDAMAATLQALGLEVDRVR